jgi:hypothetical protein
VLVRFLFTVISSATSYRFPGQRGPPSIVSVSSATPSLTGSTASGRQGVGAKPPKVLPSAPPFATPRSLASPPGLSTKQPTLQAGAYDLYDWSEDVDAPPTPTASSISVSLNSDRYKSPSNHVRDTDGPIDPDKHYECYEEDKPKRSTATAIADLFDAAPKATPIKGGAGGWGVQDDDEVDVGVNLWAGYEQPRQEAPTKIKRVKKPGAPKEKEQWICKEHGPMCNPGVCKARATYEREVRRELERKAWEEERRKRDEQRARNARRRARKEAAGTEGNEACGTEACATRLQGVFPCCGKYEQIT